MIDTPCLQYVHILRATYIYTLTHVYKIYIILSQYTQLYGRLLFLLQTTPEYIARLIRLVSLKEIDGLLQIVMFSLYGNQYEDREEHLLLSMFEVSLFCDLYFLYRYYNRAKLLPSHCYVGTVCMFISNQYTCTCTPINHTVLKTYL